MKDVPKKEQHEVTGGSTKEIGTCIPPAMPPAGPDVTDPDDSGSITQI
jgi:hypothetical protein